MFPFLNLISVPSALPPPAIKSSPPSKKLKITKFNSGRQKPKIYQNFEPEEILSQSIMKIDDGHDSSQPNTSSSSQQTSASSLSSQDADTGASQDDDARADKSRSPIRGEKEKPPSSPIRGDKEKPPSSPIRGEKEKTPSSSSSILGEKEKSSSSLNPIEVYACFQIFFNIYLYFTPSFL